MVFLLFEDYYEQVLKLHYARKQKMLVNLVIKRWVNPFIPGDASPVEIIVAKNRNGKTGTVTLHFFKSYGRFDNPTKDYEDAYAKISQSGLGDE